MKLGEKVKSNVIFIISSRITGVSMISSKEYSYSLLLSSSNIMSKFVDNVGFSILIDFHNHNS